MRIFLAGIMQGSKCADGIHAQDYRSRLTRVLNESLPEADVYDPYAAHNGSIAYSNDRGRSVFFGHNAMCREMDVILAFLPEASMGTAIEMWEGWQHGAVVIAVSPMTTNWIVRFLTHKVYDSLETLEQAIRSGEFTEIVRQNRPSA